MLQAIHSYLTMDPVKIHKKLNEIDEMLVEGYDNQTKDIKGTLLFVILVYLTYFFVNLKIE